MKFIYDIIMGWERFTSSNFQSRPSEDVVKEKVGLWEMTLQN